MLHTCPTSPLTLSHSFLTLSHSFLTLSHSFLTLSHSFLTLSHSCRTATALILVFQLSFAADLSYVSCLEVGYHSEQWSLQSSSSEEEEEEDETEDENDCRQQP